MSVIVMQGARHWTCPHCTQHHVMDHDLDDLTNLECHNCGRVTLGRLLT